MLFYDVYLDLCINANKTPSEVAKEIRIGTSTLRKWRNRNQSIPSGEVLNRVAAYFGLSRREMIVKLDDLLDRPPGSGKFPRRLELLRKFACLSQIQLAKAVNVSNKAISAYENGTRTPQIDILIRLAAFFDVELEFLLGAEDQKISTSPICKKSRDGIARGNLIRYRRESLGISVAQLATACQLAEEDIQAIEDGYDIALSNTQIEALAQALLFSADFYFSIPCGENS